MAFINLLDILYPVGSLYFSISAISPASIIGGTWTQLLQGNYIMSAGNSYAIASFGGKNTHTLTTSEMPSHNHADRVGWKDNGGNVWTGTNGLHLLAVDMNSVSANVGGGKAHNNMPCYFAVNIWYRIS